MWFTHEAQNELLPLRLVVLIFEHARALSAGVEWGHAVATAVADATAEGVKTDGLYSWRTLDIRF